MGNRDKQKKESKQPRLKKEIGSNISFFKENTFSYTPEYLKNFDYHTLTDWSTLSIAMQAILKEAYAIFNTYKPPKQFSACICPCCMSIEEEQALRTLPLSLIPRQLIYSYNDSAKPSQCNKSEVAYLLPRILELIALNEEIMHSTELYLDWFSKIPYELWTTPEKQILDNFALQYLIDEFHHAESEHTILFIEEILVMFGRTGIALSPLLTYMAQTNNFYVIASIAYLVASTGNAMRYINDVFADEYPHINILFSQWLKNNLDLLKLHADHAILSPQIIAIKSKNIKHYTELGLCLLSDKSLATINNH